MSFSNVSQDMIKVGIEIVLTFANTRNIVDSDVADLIGLSQREDLPSISKNVATARPIYLKEAQIERLSVLSECIALAELLYPADSSPQYIYTESSAMKNKSFMMLATSYDIADLYFLRQCLRAESQPGFL